MILTLPFPQARGPVASTVYPAESINLALLPLSTFPHITFRIDDGAEFHFPEVIL